VEFEKASIKGLILEKREIQRETTFSNDEIEWLAQKVNKNKLKYFIVEQALTGASCRLPLLLE
jgi:hypothetical protein